MPGKTLSKAWRGIPYLVVCALMWTCGSTEKETEEIEEELALYNDVADQLVWQYDEACSRSDGSALIVWSTPHADSAKRTIREQTVPRVIYYQAKIGGRLKSTDLSDWFMVEISSWERFFSTFSGVATKDAVESLTVSSALKEGQLRIDYADIVKLDTAASIPSDSNMTLIRFSKPFYAKSMNRAVIYLESVCSSKSSRGELLMVVLKDDKWMIEERRQVWKK